MIFRILIILFAVSESLLATDFDDFDIRRYFTLRPIIDGERYSARSRYFKTTLLHSNPYGLENLSWNCFSARYSGGRLGAEILYRSTGFERYYRRNRYKIAVGFNVYGDLNLVQALEFCREDFGDFGSRTGSNIDISAIYTASKFSMTAGIAKLNVKRPYDNPDYERFQPFAAGSFIFDRGADLTIGVRRFENGRLRWIFDQNILVTRNLKLNFGYQNKPSNIRGGMELVIEGFSILLNYNSIGGLDDSVIWGISFEK